MPPLVPAPSGFDTVGSVDQMESALKQTPPGGVVKLYLHPGSVFLLSGAALQVEDIELHLASGGEGATIDGQHLSNLFSIRNATVVLGPSLTLTNGNQGGNGGAVSATDAIVELNNVSVLNSHTGGLGGALLMSGLAAECTLRDSWINNATAAYSGGAITFSGKLLTSSSGSSYGS